MQIRILANVMDSNHKSTRQTVWELSVLCSLCQTLIVFAQRRASLLLIHFFSRCDDGNGFSSSIVQTLGKKKTSQLWQNRLWIMLFLLPQTIWDPKSFQHKLQSGPRCCPVEGCLIWIPQVPLFREVARASQPVLEYLLLFKIELSEAPPSASRHLETSI